MYDCERQDGERYAVKVFNPIDTSEDDDTILYTRKCQKREIEYMKMLHHSHIVHMEETLVKDGIIYIVMEKMTCNLLQVRMLVCVTIYIFPSFCCSAAPNG